MIGTNLSLKLLLLFTHAQQNLAFGFVSMDVHEKSEQLPKIS